MELYFHVRHFCVQLFMHITCTKRKLICLPRWRWNGDFHFLLLCHSPFIFFLHSELWVQIAAEKHVLCKHALKLVCSHTHGDIIIVVVFLLCASFLSFQLCHETGIEDLNITFTKKIQHVRKYKRHVSWMQGLTWLW